MASNKTSLYDGSVYLENGDVLDVSGRVGLIDGAVSLRATSLRYNGGFEAFAVGDEVYACQASGRGQIEHVGTVTSVTNNSGSAAGGNLDDTLGISAGTKIAIADDAFIIKHLPRFEIVAIQITKGGDFNTALVPCENHFFGKTLSDGITAWEDTYAGSFYGAVDGEAGGAVATIDFDSGIMIEGRWKRVAISSADSCICYMKAVPATLTTARHYIDA